MVCHWHEGVLFVLLKLFGQVQKIQLKEADNSLLLYYCSSHHPVTLCRCELPSLSVLSLSLVVFESVIVFADLKFRLRYSAYLNHCFLRACY